MSGVKSSSLAILTTARIEEIKEISGLTLLGLAKYSNVSYGTLKSVYYKSINASGKFIEDLCKPLNITLPVFYSFNQPLQFDLNTSNSLSKFYKRYKDAPEYFVDSAGEQTAGKAKSDKALVKELVEKTNYFDVPRFIMHVSQYLLTNYKLKFNANWIYHQLKPYVDKGILKTTDQHRPIKTGGFTRQTYKVYVHTKSSIERGLVVRDKNLSEFVSEKSSIKISKKQQGVLNLLRKNPSLTIDGIRLQLGINRSSAQKLVDQLRKKKVIEHTGPKKGGKWREL